jgi:aminopeptidase N
VITPSVPIPDGTTITVTVNYTGRPGVHVDGDGSTEGWFRVNTAAAPNDGSFVTTEPVGTASWMPLNNYPTAKPTYDFYDTVPVGKTAIANGELVGASLGPAFTAQGPTTVNAPDANFPAGSWTWHWHSPEPVANYLVENSIGSYDLTARVAASGIQYYQAQGNSITAARKATNKIAMDNQEDITTFQTTFNGPYPFTTAGVVVGIPPASFEEEMQTKITFAGGTIGGATGTSFGTLNHENMHQWFGDNVAEAGFELTFWKEGFATLGEYLNTARAAAGGGTGGDAFENSLIGRFNTNYGTSSASLWTAAPSNPTVGNLFSTNSTYTRPGTAYLALWQTLGRNRMIAAMRDIQASYGGGNITEPLLEDVFRKRLAVPSASCNARLDQFFPEWFDTAFPTGGANTTNKPKTTGPGLNGTGFVCATVDPAAPSGKNGWYTGPVSVTWHGFGASAFTKSGCDDGPVAEAS